MSEKWRCIKWKITNFSCPTPVRHLLCSKHPRKFAQTSYAQQLVLWPHFCCKQWRTTLIYCSVTHGQLWSHNKRTSGVPFANRILTWIGRFKVNQGHPYWWQPNSRTNCCRNVQQCQPYFWNLPRYCNGKTANLSMSTTPLRFYDSSVRKAFNI